MSIDDPPALFLVDVERPLTPLGSSAEDEAVGARHHVDTDTGDSGRDMHAAGRPVIDRVNQHLISTTKAHAIS